MNRLVSKAIVLKRINYGESDRIVTFITPDDGKIAVLAKAVRKPASKLAGGIELLSENEITLLKGRGELQTLISSRLIEHYRSITASMAHLQVAYDILAVTSKVSEHASEIALYELLKASLIGLNQNIDETLIGLWFRMRLLKILGHSPNLQTDSEGQKLKIDSKYHFSYENMNFTPHNNGAYTSNHIKLLRLCLTQSVEKITNLQGAKSIIKSSGILAEQALKYQI